MPQPSTGKSILEKAGIKNISLIKVTDKNTFDPSGVVRHNSGFIIDINNPLWPLSLHYQLSMQLNEKADQGAREAKTTRANTTIWTSFNKKAGKTYSQPSVQMAAKGYTGFDSTTNGFTSTIAKEGALQDEASLAAAIFGGKMPELITRIKGGDKALEVDVEVLLGLEIDPAAGKFIGPLNAKKLGQLGFYNGIDYYGHWAKPNPTAPSLVTVDFTNSLASGKRPTLPLPKGTEKKAAITDISIQEKP